MEEREKAIQQGDRWPERLAYERKREKRPSKGEKIARKAERENITLDPDRGGGCPWKKFDSEREKLFVPKGEERNDEMRGEKRNKIIIRCKENLEN